VGFTNHFNTHLIFCIATVKFYPGVGVEDLMKAGPDMGAAVEQYAS
jgi:hypothetical protein